MANGTLRMRARVRASRVLPQPVGPIRRMFDLSSSTSLLGVLAVDQPLVVVVDGDGQDLLGAVLVDHVLVELLLDLARGRDVGEEGLGDPPAPSLLVEDRLAELDAFAADVDVAGAFDQRADVAVALAAEGAIGVLLGAAGRPARRTAAAVALAATARRAAARDVLTRWHTWSFRRFEGGSPAGSRCGRLKLNRHANGKRDERWSWPRRREYDGREVYSEKITPEDHG